MDNIPVQGKRICFFVVVFWAGGSVPLTRQHLDVFRSVLSDHRSLGTCINSNTDVLGVERLRGEGLIWSCGASSRCWGCPCGSSACGSPRRHGSLQRGARSFSKFCALSSIVRCVQGDSADDVLPLGNGKSFHLQGLNNMVHCSRFVS